MSFDSKLLRQFQCERDISTCDCCEEAFKQDKCHRATRTFCRRQSYQAGKVELVGHSLEDHQASISELEFPTGFVGERRRPEFLRNDSGWM